MASIRTRILSDLLILVVLMGCIGVAVILTNRALQREQQRHDGILYTEYGLIRRAQILTRTLNEYRSSSGDDELAAYMAAKTALADDISTVTDTAVVGGNRAALTGVTNLLGALTDATDDALAAIQRRDLVATGDALERINRIQSFVEENVATLVLEELEVAREVRQAAERRSAVALGIGTAVLVLAGIGGTWYAFRISGRISSPLVELTAAAERIAAGSYGVRISEDLRRSEDETGSLARSFDVMSIHLQETIQGLQAANAAAQRAAEALESKNTLLEKLNAAFIVREGRINELKAEIARLGGTVAPSEKDGPAPDGRA